MNIDYQESSSPLQPRMLAADLNQIAKHLKPQTTEFGWTKKQSPYVAFYSGKNKGGKRRSFSLSKVLQDHLNKGLDLSPRDFISGYPVYVQQLVKLQTNPDGTYKKVPGTSNNVPAFKEDGTPDWIFEIDSETNKATEKIACRYFIGMPASSNSTEFDLEAAVKEAETVKS